MSSADLPVVDLEKFLIDQIPIAKALGVQVKSASRERVEISAPLKNNINHLGTAFGGSLNAVLVFAGYTWLYHSLRLEGLETHVILKETRVEYLSPVDRDFVAVCLAPEAEDFANFVNAVKRKSRAQIELKTTIVNGEELACRLTGTFVAKRSHDKTELA